MASQSLVSGFLQNILTVAVVYRFDKIIWLIGFNQNIWRRCQTIKQEEQGCSEMY